MLGPLLSAVLNAPETPATAGSGMPDLQSILIVYGPLGLMTFLALMVALKLYKDREADRAKFALDLKAERDRCDTERQENATRYTALEDRLIAKAESYMDKFSELGKATATVLDSALNKGRG